jgi:hypothetical protein
VSAHDPKRTWRALLPGGTFCYVLTATGGGLRECAGAISSRSLLARL